MSTETKARPPVEVVLDVASAYQLREAIRRRAVKNAHYDAEMGGFIDPDTDSKVEDIAALDEAVARWRRGDRREALHYLELALGRDFIGLGDLRPEDLR